MAHGQGLESAGTALVLTGLLDSSHGALKIILFILENNGAAFKYLEMHLVSFTHSEVLPVSYLKIKLSSEDLTHE